MAAELTSLRSVHAITARLLRRTFLSAAFAARHSYTRRFNVRHKQWGRLFGDRYKSILIDEDRSGGGSSYLATLLDYVHLNPARPNTSPIFLAEIADATPSPGPFGKRLRCRSDGSRNVSHYAVQPTSATECENLTWRIRAKNPC